MPPAPAAPIARRHRHHVPKQPLDLDSVAPQLAGCNRAIFRRHCREFPTSPNPSPPRRAEGAQWAAPLDSRTCRAGGAARRKTRGLGAPSSAAAPWTLLLIGPLGGHAGGPFVAVHQAVVVVVVMRRGVACSRVVELLGLGAAGQRRGGGLAARDRHRHRVEIAHADFALVPRRGVALGLRRRTRPAAAPNRPPCRGPCSRAPA